MRLNQKLAAILGVCAIATKASAATQMLPTDDFLPVEGSVFVNPDYPGVDPQIYSSKGPVDTSAYDDGRMYKGQRPQNVDFNNQDVKPIDDKISKPDNNKDNRPSKYEGKGDNKWENNNGKGDDNHVKRWDNDEGRKHDRDDKDGKGKDRNEHGDDDWKNDRDGDKKQVHKRDHRHHKNHRDGKGGDKNWNDSECEDSGNDTDKWTDNEDCDSEHGDDHDDKDNKRVHRRNNRHHKNRRGNRRGDKDYDHDSQCEDSGNDTDKWTDNEDCDSDREDYDHKDRHGRSRQLKERFEDEQCENNGLTTISEKEVTKTTTKFGLSPAFIIKLKEAQMRAENAKAALNNILCDLEQAQDEVKDADEDLTILLKKITHQKRAGWSKKD